MFTSQLKDRVVWLTVTGEFLADDLMGQVSKWLPRLNEFDGFITDMRQTEGSPSPAEQKKAEEWRKKNNTGKPNAILGKDNGMSMLVKIYVRFTGAKNARYFTDETEAINWIRSFKN